MEYYTPVVKGGRYIYKRKEGFALQKAIKERQFIYDTLDEITPNYCSDSGLKIITGGARGVDTHALDWAMVNRIKYMVYHADWKKHKNAAGPIRNQLMLDSEVPKDEYGHFIVSDFLVIAFPGGKGTKDMTNRAKKIGIEVIEVEYESN